MSYDDTGYDGALLAIFTAVLAAYVILIAVTIVLLIVDYVLMGFALSGVFRKVGVKPWTAWVPYYNYWKLLEVGGLHGWFVLLVLAPFGSYVYLVFHYIGMYRIGAAFGKDGGWTVLGVFLPWVWAFMLGYGDAVYRPEIYAARGWPLPLVGHGAVARPGL